MRKQIKEPEKRGLIRKKLGKEYFVLKRRLKWLIYNSTFASTKNNSICKYTVFTHKSMLLRPLKDVDMILQHNKVTNLRLAIRGITGIAIKPQETFSLWKLSGRPTKRKGYLEGMTLHNGAVSKDIGGGLCQLGNLIYWMALHTDLDVTEHYRHSYDVFPDINRTIPFACGATLSYNYIDLQLKNNTDKIYQINLWIDDENLNGEIKCNEDIDYTFQVVETDHQIVQQWWGGYTRHNRIWKHRIAASGEEIDKELVSENHAIMMYSPLLSDGKTNYSR